MYMLSYNNKRVLAIHIRKVKKFFAQLIIILFFIILIFSSYLLHYFQHPLDICSNKIAKVFNLQYKKLIIEGIHNISDDEISKIIPYKHNTNITKIDLEKICLNFGSKNYVKKCIAYRIFPHTILIKIKQKKPIAIYRDKNINHVIDKYGNFFVPNLDESKIQHLIILLGKNANLNAYYLTEKIKKEKFLHEQVNYAVFLGLRRWNIILKSGIFLKMPEDNFEKALQWSSDFLQKNKGKFLGKKIKSIDLRNEEKYFVEIID